MYRIVFEWQAAEGQEESFLRQWQRGSEVIQTSSGARGTRLFRSLEEPGVFFAMADWDSEAIRDEAMARLEARDDADEVLRGHQRYLRRSRIVGRLELVADSPSD